MYIFPDKIFGAQFFRKFKRIFQELFLLQEALGQLILSHKILPLKNPLTVHNKQTSRKVEVEFHQIIDKRDEQDGDMGIQSSSDSPK